MIQDRIKALRKHQLMLLWGGVLGLTILSSILAYFLLSSNDSKEEAKTFYKSEIRAANSHIDLKSAWMEQFKVEMDVQNKKFTALEQTLDKLLKLNASSPEENELSQDKQSQNKQEQEDKVRDSQALVKKEVLPKEPQTLALPPTIFPVNPKEFPNREGVKPHEKGLLRTSIKLVNARHDKTLKTPDNTIPAGAFARATLLGGVDASTSIQSSSDPRPVLLRLTHPGTLPRRFRSDLCGCHVLAACHGDMSSERVFMRLEKLTCTERKTGEIIELDVSGYVAGEDGRAGLRGIMVDRAGPIMRNAAIGGFLSGIGQMMGGARSPLTFSPTTGLAQTNPMTNGEILREGAAKGAGNALEKYADFYIKRAEQMQPVLMVEAGRLVDIVFTKGVAFDGSQTRSAISKVNDTKRVKTIQHIEQREE